MTPTVRSPRQILVDVILWTVVAAILSWHLAWLARQRFDFFDMSGFLDAGYRVYRGQKLYGDFFYHAGPVHPAMHALSFKTLGFNQFAVVAHLLVVQAVVLAAVYALARRELSRAAGVALLVVVSLTFFCTTAHPWYDQNAAALVVLAILLFELAHPFRKSPAVTWLAPAACGAAVTLSFLTKANIGAAGAAVLLAAFAVGFRKPRDLLPPTAFVLGALAAAAIVVASLDSPAGFVRDNFEEFHAGERLSDRARFATVLTQPVYTIACVTVGALVALVVLARLRGDRQILRATAHRLVLAAGLLSVAVFSAWTGSMLVRSNILLVGIILLYVWLILARLAASAPERGWAQPSVAAVAWAYAICCAALGWQHRLATWDWRASDRNADYTLRTPAFAGWRCNGKIGRGFDDAVEYINARVPADDELFIFPDATIIYGLTERQSFRGVPFMFDLLQQPPESVFKGFRKRFLSAPPKWILIHDQSEVPFFAIGPLLKYMQLGDAFTQWYSEVWSSGEFRLLQLRPGLSPTDLDLQGLGIPVDRK